MSYSIKWVGVILSIYFSAVKWTVTTNMSFCLFFHLKYQIHVALRVGASIPHMWQPVHYQLENSDGTVDCHISRAETATEVQQQGFCTFNSLNLVISRVNHIYFIGVDWCEYKERKTKMWLAPGSCSCWSLAGWLNSQTAPSTVRTSELLQQEIVFLMVCHARTLLRTITITSNYHLFFWFLSTHLTFSQFQL